tara:strand:+ start:6224 stop:7276 length:1053 start_codon:yes stop_codon:yes gene_type:complete
MITGTPKTEAQYRAIPMDSSSSIKEFSQDRKKYYKKYYLKEKIEEKDNAAANMGRIVETLLMEPHLFDEYFYMSACAATPTGLMLEFVEALYRVTRDSVDAEGKVTKNFDELTLEAYNLSGFKIKYDAVIGKFLNSDSSIYYNEIRMVRTKNLIVVNSLEISIAEKIVEKLKSNSTTGPIVNLVNSSRYTIVDQMKIEGYKIDDLPLKSMLDKVIIDHDKKLITPYDLKCTWSVENFYEEYYLYRRAYIQAYLYYRAMLKLSDDEESEYYGYTVEYLKFIVCDSTNYYQPLIYTIDIDDMLDAYNGFTHKGRNYPGVGNLISALNWCKETDTWNISHKNYLSNGIVNIKG